MRDKINGMPLFFLLACSLLCSETHVDEQRLENDIKIFSEHVGYQFARDLKEESDCYDLDSIINGIRKYIDGNPSMKEMSDEENDEKLSSIEYRLSEEQAKMNLERAESYLRDIRKKQTGISLENGNIVYEIVSQGEGNDLLCESDGAKIHYTILDIEGKPIISNLQETACACKLDELLPALRKTMIGMKRGERRKVCIHPTLAYGKFGVFPPNTLVIIDVQLREIVRENTEKS